MQETTAKPNKYLQILNKSEKSGVNTAIIYITKKLTLWEIYCI